MTSFDSIFRPGLFEMRAALFRLTVLAAVGLPPAALILRAALHSAQRRGTLCHV